MLKTSAGNIKVKNGKGKSLTVIDAAGKETSQIYPSIAPVTVSSDLTYDSKKTAVTLASSFSGTFKASDYVSTVKKVDASKVSKAVNIVGNAQANSILGGDGKDIITDYTAGQDKIKLASDTISSVSKLI